MFSWQRWGGTADMLRSDRGGSSHARKGNLTPRCVRVPVDNPSNTRSPQILGLFLLRSFVFFNIMTKFWTSLLLWAAPPGTPPAPHSPSTVLHDSISRSRLLHYTCSELIVSLFLTVPFPSALANATTFHPGSKLQTWACPYHSLNGPWLEYWRESEYATPQTCHYSIGIDLSWRQLRSQNAEKALCPPPCCLDAGHKFPFVKVFTLSSPITGRTTLITRDRPLSLWSGCTNKPYENNPCLSLVSPI